MFEINYLRNNKKCNYITTDCEKFKSYLEELENDGTVSQIEIMRE